MDQPVAVLMGDIIGSRGVSDTMELHSGFNLAIDRQNSRDRNKLVSALTITLGDEFQGLYKNPTDAAIAARSIRFALLENRFDCRFVIGLAWIETPISSNRSWNILGKGLPEARSILNEKRAGQFYRFSLPEAPDVERVLDALGSGLSVIERSWTPKQLRDIRAQLNGTSPEALAAERGVTVRSIYKVRKGGEYDAYILQWQAVLDALGAHDKLFR